MTTTITNNQNTTDLDSSKHCSLTKMDAGQTSGDQAADDRPVLHKRMNTGQGTEIRPKSNKGKVLVRKNTPALLPKVDKIYAKDVSIREPVLTEEDESTCCEKTTSEEGDKPDSACLN